MRKNPLYIILLLGVLFSCKKDKLPEIPPQNVPLFSVSGEIEGNTFELIAGVDNTIMKDEVQIRNNVAYFIGEMEQENQKVTFSIADGELDQINKDWEINEATFLSILPIYELPVFSMNVFSFSNSQMITSIQWEVNGELMSGEQLEFNEPGVYTVCGNFSFLGGESATICNDLIIGFDRESDLQLIFDYIEPNVYQLNIDPSESVVSSVNWYINDSLYSTEKSPVLYANDLNNIVRSEVLLENGVARVREVYINTSNQEVYVQDFGNLEKNTDLIIDYNAEINLDLSFGSYKAIPYGGNNEIEIIDVLLYETSEDKNIFLIKARYIGSVLNLNTEGIVDAQINFNFALPINK